jgi:UDP-perosamine 4-acetyltransferase
MVRVDDHAHIATGARLAGSVKVGRSAIVGSGVVVRIAIDVEAVVGAGALVIRDVAAGTAVVGNSATVMEWR